MRDPARSHPIFKRANAAYSQHLADWVPELEDQLYGERKTITEGTPTHLYAIYDEATDAVKFGIGKDPKHRLKGLQIGNPRELRLLAWCPSTLAFEQFLHVKLWPWRILGEWFSCSTEVLAVVSLVMAGDDLRQDSEDDSLDCGDVLWFMAGPVFEAAELAAA